MTIARFSRDALATAAIAFAVLLTITAVGRLLHHASPTYALVLSCLGVGTAFGVYVGALRVAVAAIDRAAAESDPRTVRAARARACAGVLPAIVVLVVAVWATRRAEDEAPLILWATILVWATLHLLGKATSRRVRWLSTHRPGPIALGEYSIATGLATYSGDESRRIDGTLTLSTRGLVFTDGGRRIDVSASSSGAAHRMWSPASGIVLDTDRGRVRLQLADPDRWLKLLERGSPATDRKLQE